MVNLAFLSRERNGVCQSFLPALASHRIIWITQRFVEVHERFATDTYHRMQTAGGGCNWRLAKSEQHFLERCSKEKSKAILFCIDADKELQAWQPVKHKLTLVELITFFCQIDPQRSLGGFCQR